MKTKPECSIEIGFQYTTWSVKETVLTGRPGAHKYPGGLEKICATQKPGIIFQSPKFFKHKSNFLILRDFFFFFLQISTNIRIKRVQIWSEVGFYDAKCKNLRPIFAAALKSIFEKVVILC